MSLKRTIYFAALTQLVGLILAGWWFQRALNTDAIAYLRLAEYYAEGKSLLAVSGYWGPLLSWLMAPMLKLGCAPLLAARLVMGVSAVIFFWGCQAWFRAAELPESWRQRGAWTAALVSIPWSVGNITPDLLLAGLLPWVGHFLLQAARSRPFYYGLLAGLAGSVAYLTKAVALPLAVLAGLAWFGWLWWQRRAADSAMLTALAGFLLGLAILVVQWTCLLTYCYGRLTITTSAPISHAIAGPSDKERYHPTMRSFHPPPPGRITSWEDPSEMPYHDWSPFENGRYALHQAGLMANHLGLSQVMLTTIFLDWPCVLGLLLWRCWRKRRKSGQDHPSNTPSLQHSIPYEFSALFLLSLTLVYLPNYLRFADQRLFYPALPFLFVSGLWLVERLCAVWPQLERWWSGALMASFLLPAAVVMFLVLPPKRQAGELAHQLAAALAQTKMPPGPLAGSALQPGGRVGLYTAFLLDLPWHGDEPRPTVESCRRSGARYFVVNREDPLAEALAKADGFVDVTTPFKNRPAVRVFRLNPSNP